MQGDQPSRFGSTSVTSASVARKSRNCRRPSAPAISFSRGLGLAPDDPLELAPEWRETDQTGPCVGRIRLQLDVTHALEVAEQIVHRLLRHLHLVGDLGRAPPVEALGAEEHCAGQASVDENGAPLHAGDITAQANQALDNLEKVLDGAAMTLANVVRLNYYTTDVDAFFVAAETVSPRLAASGCHPASTLLGVQRLAFPELMLEIEATAVA